MRRYASGLDSEMHRLSDRLRGQVRSHWRGRNDHSTIVRRSASHAVLDALRPILNRRCASRVR
ncbi:hypothetical protein F4W70_10470 [Pseudomonas cannabina]|nr:hypothetical protein F4W70_10470 [Pseudomonas cannabina]